MVAAACAELHAAKVADDKDNDVGQFVGVNLPEDRFAGCAARFAVVVGAERLALGTNHIGPADVAGVVVLPLVLLHQRHRLLDRADRMRKSEELTPEFGISTLAFGCYGLI